MNTNPINDLDPPKEVQHSDSTSSSSMTVWRWLGALCCFILLRSLLYLSSTLPQWNEISLIGLTLLLGLIILAPQVRSGLIRRRLFLTQWLRDDHQLFHWLKGGAFYVGRHFVISFFWATLILVELQHFHLVEHWILLGGFGSAFVLQMVLFKILQKWLQKAPASVFAREWTVLCIRWGLVLVLIPTLFYLPKPDLNGLSFQEVLTFSLPKSDQVAYGLFGFLQLFSQVKENTFWWFILNYEQLITLPPLLLNLFHWILIGLYCLYSLSVIYAMSRLISGLIELTDPYFYRFIRSKPS